MYARLGDSTPQFDPDLLAVAQKVTSQNPQGTPTTITFHFSANMVSFGLSNSSVAAGVQNWASGRGDVTNWSINNATFTSGVDVVVNFKGTPIDPNSMGSALAAAINAAESFYEGSVSFVGFDTGSNPTAGIPNWIWYVGGGLLVFVLAGDR